MRHAIQQNRVWYCQECGKCSAVCPITRGPTPTYTSPRLLVEKALGGRTEAVRNDPLFWSCLTCKLCSELCPSDVYFSDFIREARILARAEGQRGECAHGEVIQIWGRMMTAPELRQQRRDWLDGSLKVTDDAETLYFSGCLPYYDTLFKSLGAEGVAIARAAVKILNHLGIAPQVMVNERCCGHDQLWEGDLETFRALAQLNLELLRATGAKRIVTTCPECALTLAREYPRLVGHHGMQVWTLPQFLARESAHGRLAVDAPRRKIRVTYQDPCRLGRYLNAYDEPRALMRALGLDLVEMDRTRTTSLCCGTSGWTACGRVNKSIQVERLQEAVGTGAELLVTACVKCQIHFKCAQQDALQGDKIAIQIQDLTT
ncbi:MAG: (Fe-S)-binding protein, partial [Desulfobacterales bacterium]